MLHKRNNKICFLLLFFLFLSFLTAINASADTIIDNRDAATSRVGTWSVSSGMGSYGVDSVFSRKNTTVTPTFTWNFTPSQSGNYAVSMWWTYRDSRSTSVPVDIEYSGGTARVVVNQKLNGSTWNVLGTYPFVAGVSYRVTITAQPIPTSESTTCADAVKFVPVSTQSYTISATAGSGGSISPSGDVSVPSGADQTFTITANTGYHVTSVVVDGGPAGAIQSYTFYSVTFNHTIAATFAIDNPSQETIIDNRDTATLRVGTWSVSSGMGSYGVDSVYSRKDTTVTPTFTWNFTPSQSGNYAVSMWWTYRDSRSTSVPIDIEYSGSTARVVVNQKLNGSAWNVLGTYPFVAGVSYKVTVTAQPIPTSSSTTCADAVKFAYVSGGGNTPPVAVIDSISPNPALPGQAVTFAGHGTDSDGIITGYSWRSSIGGPLSNLNTFTTSSFAAGTHVIYFKVKDDKGAWSPEVSRTLQVSGQTSNTEYVYVGALYDSKSAYFIQVLRDMGATQQGDVWKYTNTSNHKTYIVHFLDNFESTKQAMYSEDSVIILQGHANYGLGGVYSTTEESTQGTVYDLYYMDDGRLLNWSSPWVALNVKSCIESHAFPNWWPVFEDGTSAVMPYVHGDPQGDPPYNYYITYQAPGDPTFYKVRDLQRFADSGKPAWDPTPNGTSPSPTNADHLKYYITNTDTSPVTRLCGSRICPRAHYGSKTIVFRKELDVDQAQLKYKRMIYVSCSTGIYYLDTFQHGIMFYSVIGTGGEPAFIFLKAYLEGKSDHEIWELIQDVSRAFDYYDFSKRPSEQ
jgi:hypothetical protein